MTFNEADIHQVGKILQNVARLEILPRFRKLSSDQIRQKSAKFDLVTEADEAAEVAITEALSAIFPDALVIGEETAHYLSALPDRIREAELAFIIDPIDGTKNFVSHLPLFGVMAAVTARGDVVAGVIHDPISRDWAYAIKGRGAWLEREDGVRSPMRVAPPIPVSQMEAFVSTTHIPEPLRATLTKNLSRLATNHSLRCAAHEYRAAAGGYCDLLVFGRLMPWDHAAGWLLHKEAGGYSAHFDGSPYLPTNFSGGLICAADRNTWQTARSVLLEANA